MDRRRRQVLKAAGGVGASVVLPAAGRAGAQTAPTAPAARDLAGFDTRSIDEVIASLVVDKPVESAAIRISAPDVAEDGRVVSIGITSALPSTDRIVILVEKNPNRIVASFTLPEGTAPSIATRIKMNGTSDVYALVRASGRFFFARREVRVTVGGCGV